MEKFCFFCPLTRAKCRIEDPSSRLFGSVSAPARGDAPYPRYALFGLGSVKSRCSCYLDLFSILFNACPDTLRTLLKFSHPPVSLRLNWLQSAAFTVQTPDLPSWITGRKWRAREVSRQGSTGDSVLSLLRLLEIYAEVTTCSDFPMPPHRENWAKPKYSLQETLVVQVLFRDAWRCRLQ